MTATPQLADQTRRLRLSTALILTLFLIIAGRLVQMQITEGPALAMEGLSQRLETVYLPALDAVLVGAKAKAGWLLYDCGKNAWRAADLPGADPIARGVFNNSMGLMYDPARKLVWAVGQNSHVHVLRLDAATLKVTALD